MPCDTSNFSLIKPLENYGVISSNIWKRNGDTFRSACNADHKIDEIRDKINIIHNSYDNYITC